jgi:hypothetical protein
MQWIPCNRVIVSFLSHPPPLFFFFGITLYEVMLCPSCAEVSLY